jgi:hypothetical protein
MMTLYLVVAFIAGIAFTLLAIKWLGNNSLISMREEMTDDEKISRRHVYNQIYSKKRASAPAHVVAENAPL